MRTSSTLKGLAPLLSGLLYVAAPAFAEQQAYTMPQAVEHARRHNGEFAAFREEQGLREAARTRAGLLPNPTLDLEGATGAPTGSSDEKRFSIGISQEFFLAGKRGKRLAVAEHELEMYRWQLADRERLLREEVKTAFYDALLAKERVALADRSIALNRQLLEVTKERLAAGDIPELEMNLVKVELARGESSRIELAKALLQSRARLWTLMGLPIDQQPGVSGKLEAEPATAPSLIDLKQFAGANRPDLKALESEKSRGEADISLAQAEQIPNLTAGFFYSQEQRADATGAGEEKVRDNLLGVRLSIPIPIFDRNQAGIQEAQARRNSSENRRIAVVRNVEREVETAYAGLQNAASVLALYKADIIPQLEENLKLTQEAYRLGEVGILAVIQEQKKFFEVSDGYLTALHGRQAASVKLESVTASEFTGGAQ